MRRNWLRSMRGHILVWYMCVLGAVLLGYCVFQTVTLSNYFRSANAMSLRQSAAADLATVAPFCIESPADLHRSAASLAWLLGSQTGTATVVTPEGRILVSHSAGAGQPLPPSARTIRRLIPSPTSARRPEPNHRVLPPCHPAAAAPHQAAMRSASLPVVGSGNVLRTAIPLGPANGPVGYAILGRSVEAEGAALLQLRSTLWAGAVVVLLVTAIVALPIMNRGLRPLTRVTATAEAIAAGDLDRRANLGTPVDEVGRLGRAFDTMVDRLDQALSSATASEEHMRRFLADASHELRTPLTVLCGTSEILFRQRGLDRAETDAALLAINQETTRMARLVDDLLRLSRLDAGQPLHPRPLTVSTFLEEFVDRYAPAWPERSVQVEISNLNGTQVDVDPEALTRVLTNLVDNAARYSAARRPIRIQGAAADRTVRITVADEGPGLSGEDARRAFERFYRGSKSRSRQTGGSGLGLAIVQALVHQSQGEVHLESGPDRGTSVTVTLPRRTELSEPSDP